MNTELRIRGMVCGRCIQAVEGELKALGLVPTDIQLGVAAVSSINTKQLHELSKRLETLGFSLLVDRKAELIQLVKDLIQETLQRDDLGDNKVRYSDLLEEKTGVDYDTLSSLFSGYEGITIEKYTIEKRLDNVKEWLVYSDLTLSEIAYRTGFSSLQHLSNQFKQVTGLSPSHFKMIKAERDEIRHRIAEHMNS
jgi:AraC family transcriptional regulator